MTALVWDQVGDRFFETSVDRGVFYSPHNLIDSTGGVETPPLYPAGVPWNGLVAVDVLPENLKQEPLYFDGQKTLDLVSPGNFSATLKAITYPDEFVEFDGFSEVATGRFIDNQPRDTFGLSYRTKIGSDTNVDLGYKIHILYNLTAIPTTIPYQTEDSNIHPIIFSWEITGIPEVVSGYRPSAHFVIDTTKVDSGIVSSIETLLYGSESSASYLPPISAIMSFGSG